MREGFGIESIHGGVEVDHITGLLASSGKGPI